jgi:hypothetical protein
VSWRLRHLDHVGGVNHADIECVTIVMSGELGVERSGAADEIHANPEVPRRRQGAVDNACRRVIATHRINSNTHL